MEKIEELAKFLECDVEDIVEGYDEDHFEYGDQEYAVYTDSEADDAAYNDIENSIDEMGLEAFTPSFQDWIVENALDNENWFEGALQEDMEYYVDEMEEDELIQELLQNGFIRGDDIHYDSDDEDEEYPILNDDVDLDDAKEQYTAYLVENAGDPYQWFVSNFGQEQVRRLIKDGTIGLDTDAIVEECLSLDGRGHFLSGYDGKELYLGDDLYAYRQN